MTFPVSDTYNPRQITATGAAGGPNTSTGCFICTTAGTLQIRGGTTITDPIVIASIPVAVGQYIPLPFTWPNGLFVELGGGAIGTLGTN
jgi:hypothetical protein